MSARGDKMRVGQVEIYAEETGQGSQALVFLHHWGGSRRTWSGVVERLSDRFRCIAVDLRGWGRSDRQAEDYSLFAQANDVERILKTVSDRMAPNLKEARQRVERVSSKVSNYLKDGTTANCSLADASLRVSNP